MKVIVNIARVLTGILFIFSGLIKANDPRGLSYKMQEFFDVWSADPSLKTLMVWLDNYALPLSIIMITLEVIVGVGLLLGIKKKLFSTLLLILIIFFGFLTGYAVLSGKIATCGCFGDCIPLTALQSFIKDLILFALILLIFFERKHIVPFLKNGVNYTILLLCTIAILCLQWYVLQHMPLADCLPFKKGNNIIELSKVPANAVQEKKDYKFYFKKNEQEKEFSENNLPDSTWQFVRREDIILQEAKNNNPVINDFELKTSIGNDSTEAILNTSKNYYLFLIKDTSNSNAWLSNFSSIVTLSKNKKRLLYIVTSQPQEAQQFFNIQHNFNVPVLSLDATALKTAARTSPELYLMRGAIVEDKWGRADLQNAIH